MKTNKEDLRDKDRAELYTQVSGDEDLMEFFRVGKAGIEIINELFEYREDQYNYFVDNFDV